MAKATFPSNLLLSWELKFNLVTGLGNVWRLQIKIPISQMKSETLLRLPISWDQFHKGFISSWFKYCENFFCSSYDYNYQIWSQICTCHGSWAVVTCAKLWPDLIIIFQVKSMCSFSRFGLSVHKPYVKWVTGLSTQSNWHSTTKAIDQTLEVLVLDYRVP